MKFIEKPTEILLSIFAIGMGAWLPTLSELKDNDVVKILATLFAVVGGAVLSKALTSERKVKEKEAEKWKKHYNDRINPINSHLASLTKDIYSTLNKAEGQSISHTEALRHISQMTSTLVGAMTDLSQVINKKFDPSTLYETTQQIEELTTLLNSIGLTNDITQRERLVEEVKDRIASIHPDVYIKVEEPISCPHCNAHNVVQIGKMPPASQIVSCSSCQLPFHTHRTADLSVIAKKPGTFHIINTSTKVDVECKCGAKFNATVKGEYEERPCRECGTVIHITKDGEFTFIDREKNIQLEEVFTSEPNLTK